MPTSGAPTTGPAYKSGDRLKVKIGDQDVDGTVETVDTATNKVTVKPMQGGTSFMIDMPAAGQPVVTKAAWYRIKTIAGDLDDLNEEEKRWQYLDGLLEKATKKEVDREAETTERVDRGGHGIPVYTVTKRYDMVTVHITLPEPISNEDWQYLKESIANMDDSELMVEDDREISDREIYLDKDMRTIWFSYDTERPYNTD